MSNLYLVLNHTCYGISIIPFDRVGLMQQDEDEDVPRCLLSRLDTMTCLYRNENLRRAGINK